MNPDYEYMVRCRLFIFNAVQASSPTNRLCQNLKLETVRFDVSTGTHALIRFAPAKDGVASQFASGLMFATTYLAHSLFQMIDTRSVILEGEFIFGEMLAVYNEQNRLVSQATFSFEQLLGDGYELETEYRAAEDSLDETILDFVEKVFIARLTYLVELLDEYYFLPAQFLGFSSFPTDLKSLAETHERVLGRI